MFTAVDTHRMSVSKTRSPILFVKINDWYSYRYPNDVDFSGQSGGAEWQHRVNHKNGQCELSHDARGYAQYVSSSTYSSTAYSTQQYIVPGMHLHLTYDYQAA